MKRRTIAIAASIATLSLAAAPLAAASTDTHRGPEPTRDRSHHVEKRGINKQSRDRHLEVAGRR